MDQDQAYMRKALELARLGLGRTSPNPAVGALLVKDGRIIAGGYHRKAGTDHAEVVAIKKADGHAAGATLYVTMEPCCHYGRTPPCTRAVIEAGISRVVVAARDPNPLVSGKGLEELQAHGIEVQTGVLEEEARQLNEAFFKYVAEREPFVAAKWAMSLDGKIAASSGESRWISGEEARLMVHRLRDQYDCVMVGIGTVLADDPQLTTRLPEGGGRDPVRIVLDSYCRIPLEARVLNLRSDAPTVIVTTGAAPRERIRALQAKGAEVWVLRSRGGRVDLRHLMEELSSREITSVLLEGGGTLNAAALETGIVDKVYAFVCPIIIGGTASPGPVGGRGAESLVGALRLERLHAQHVGEDLLLTGYPKKASPAK